MEEQAITQYPLLAVAIVTAIPVVMFTLWADYFGRYLTELGQEEPDYDRTLQLGRIRMAGLWTWLAELVVFLAMTDLRRQAPFSSMGIFFFALIFQSQVQFSLERRVRRLEVTLKDQLKTAARVTVWIFSAMVIYFSAAMALAAAVYFGGKAMGVPQEAMLYVRFGAQLVGIFGALGLTFALSPFYLRRFLPVERVSDGKVHGTVKGCFSRAGLPMPDVWIVGLRRWKWANALVAGFPRGRWIFRPGIYLSETLIDELSSEELEAVVFHEASHLRLNHLRRRLIVGFVTLCGAIVAAGLLTLVVYRVYGEEAAHGARVAGFMAALVVPFFTVRSRMRRQETEADLFAVASLGARVEVFASALRKIDQANGRSSEHLGAEKFLAPTSGHPSTERRLLILRTALETLRRPQSAATQADENVPPSDTDQAA